MKSKIINWFKSKYFVIFVCGSFSALAFAPIYFFPAAIVGFSALVLFLENSTNKKESFLIGWFFGLGQFLFGLYWISISLFVDIAKYFWLLPFSLFLIPSATGIFTGFATLFTNFFAKKISIAKWQKVLLLAVSWLFFEWIRSYVFSGFLWNLIGYSFFFSENLLQNASLFGIFGLSIIAVIFYSFPALFFEIKNSQLKFVSNKSAKIFSIATLSFMLAMFLYGHLRLQNSANNLIANTNIRLVQANIAQSEKWDPESRFNSFMENINLTLSDGFDEINYVIWPESAIPYILESGLNDEGLIKEIARAVPKNGFLISGGLRAKFQENHSKMIDQVWNSIFMIGDNGKIINHYDKNNLVPFGEYIPLQKAFPFISKITDGNVGFSVGDGPKTIRLDQNLPSFSPLICYEVSFPTRIIDQNNPPEFLLNVTNDAWFGNSSGPYQHFDMARMRSVENGIPLLRVANSGISALVDPYGRIISKLNINEKGFLDVKLMKNLPATFYARHGLELLLILFLIILLALSPLNLINKNGKNKPKSLQAKSS